MIGLILMGLGVVLLFSAIICVNIDRDIYFVKFLVTGTILMFIGYSFLVVGVESNGRKMMQECIQSGGEWVRYSEHGFACIGDKK